MRTWMRVAAVAALVLTPLAACGDDDDDEGTPTNGASGELTAFCENAEEMDQQEDFPTAQQAREYEDLAPDELQDELDVVVPVFEDNDGDQVATLAAFAEDDVAEAIRALNVFETEQCGIDHSDDPSEEVQVDEAANRVDVTAVEYEFQGPESVPAGVTSFVLTNDGVEAHFLNVVGLAEGHTVEELIAAYQTEDENDDAGLVTDVDEFSDLAAPGGEDEEVINMTLESGTYAMLCFISDAEGTPHAFRGMARQFTVE